MLVDTRFTQAWAPLSTTESVVVASLRVALENRAVLAGGSTEPTWLSFSNDLTRGLASSAFQVAADVVEGTPGAGISTPEAGVGSLGTPVRARTSSHEETLTGLLQDWRELKLEREVWRSLDLLGQSRQSLSFRRKYYAELFEPASMTSKVST